MVTKGVMKKVQSIVQGSKYQCGGSSSRVCLMPLHSEPEHALHSAYLISSVYKSRSLHHTRRPIKSIRSLLPIKGGPAYVSGCDICLGRSGCGGSCFWLRSPGLSRRVIQISKTRTIVAVAGYRRFCEKARPLTSFQLRLTTIQRNPLYHYPSLSAV